jgi:hypothetical protein
MDVPSPLICTLYADGPSPTIVAHTFFQMQEPCMLYIKKEEAKIRRPKYTNKFTAYAKTTKKSIRRKRPKPNKDKIKRGKKI